ncbi:MAG: gliding motility-associated C-terminal domain-containing protein [Saprospiraceae bacterium]
MAITEPEALTLAMFQDSVNCFGSATGLAWVAPTGGTGSYQYAWDNGSTTDTLFTAAAGIHTVVVTDANNCTAMESIDVLEPTALQVDATAQDAACFGTSTGELMITAQGGTGTITYEWSNSSGIVVGTAADLNGLPADDYSVVATDNNGCTATGTAQIGQPPLLDITNLQTNNPLCQGAMDGTAQIAITGGVMPYVIQWDGALGNEQTTGLAAGMHNVLVTDANQCTFSLDFQLTAPQSVGVSLSMTSVSCFGFSDGSALASPEGGTPPYSFTWSNGSSSPTASGLPAGIASVTITDENGCQVENSITVESPATLTLALTGIDPSCFGGGNGTINAEVTGGTPDYTFLWSNGQTTPFTLVGLTAQTYELTVTDANDCEMASAFILEEPTVLTATTQTTEQACTGPPNGQATALPSGGTMPYSFEWEDGQTGITANGLTAGNYGLTVTDAQGCTFNTSATVALASNVSIDDWQVTDASCFGFSNGSVQVSLSGGTMPYSWNAPLNGLSAGNYSFTVTDANNCTDVLEITIQQPTAVAATADITNVVCAGETTGAIGLTVSGGVQPYIYLWNTGSSNNTLSSLGAGAYAYTVTDAQGCVLTQSATVEQASTLRVTSEQEDILCNSAATGHITPQVSGGQPPYTFAWSNGSDSAVLAGIPAGDYSLTVTDDYGCQVFQQYNITQPDVLIADLLVTDVNCHGGRDGLIRVQAQGGTPPYRYRHLGTDYQSNPAFLGLEAGDYFLYVQDANGCIYPQNPVEVVEPAEITIDLGGNRSLAFGDSIRIIPAITGDYDIVQYIWTPFDSTWMSCTDCIPLEVKPENQRDLFLEVVDENGCTAKAWIQLRVTKDFPVYVPSGFTPNGDAVNSRLLVHGLPGIEVLHFRVWDRWGELLYEEGRFPVNAPDHGWDGRFREQPMNSGVYIWQVEALFPDGKTTVLKGQVMLIR